MLKAVDYDQGQHRNYVAGRDLGPAHARGWMHTFAERAPPHRPLDVLDLGSGSGRFDDALAETFGGAVYGVEPSAQMRAAALERRTNLRVEFLAGTAEAIPLPDASVDLVLMFLSFHHVRDREKAGREIARVLRPGGRVLIRNQFSDRFPDLGWHAHFPRAREIELAMFPSAAEVEASFASFGIHRLDLISVQERFADSLAEHAGRLHQRAISTFEHMSEAEMDEGFARLDAAVAREVTPTPVIQRSDVMVLGRD